MWFAKWGVRPEGVQFAGGVRHSLSNSLSAVMMAGMYYEATGDAAFFRDHPELTDRLSAILDEMLLSRRGEDPWLFPSEWISDGLAMGDFHTGSNITAWYALFAYARVLREALGDAARAQTYCDAAERVKAEILTRCVTPSGPFGEQLLEGIGMGPEALQAQMKADSEEAFREKNSGFGIQFYDFYNRRDDGPYLVHDGEETDTTLASFYGLLPRDFPALRNYTRFAMTEHNRFYCPVSKGILWEDCTDSTFPGYVTGLANAVDRDSFAPSFQPFRNLADLDGSIWWWPYPHAARDSSRMDRRPGKCGWASGAMLALLQSDILGIRWDGVKRCLYLRPLTAVGDFTWKSMPLGGARFDLTWTAGTLTVRNMNRFAVQAEIALPESARVRREGEPNVSVRMLPGEQICVPEKNG